jgi:hypothetical protein
MHFCTAMFVKVERRRHLALDAAAVQECGASRLLTLTSSSTREKYMCGCWRRASMNGSGKRGETQTSVQSVSQSESGRNQQTLARLQSKVLGQHRNGVGHTASSKSLLSSVRPSPTLASMARTASSCWQQRDASSARHASLSAHRCCDARRTRARTAPSTASAVPGVAACSSLPSVSP